MTSAYGRQAPDELRDIVFQRLRQYPECAAVQSVTVIPGAFGKPSCELDCEFRVIRSGIVPQKLLKSPRRLRWSLILRLVRAALEAASRYLHRR